MSIRIFLGNVGSGKTAYAVREMYLDKSNKMNFSNIKTTKLNNSKLIKREMIIKKEQIGTRKNGEAVFSSKLNIDFWTNIRKKYKAINLYIDEAHSIFNSRRATSKINIIMSDYVALMRKMLGEQDSGVGDLTFITQLDRRIDVIARDMSTQIKHFTCYYIKKCTNCLKEWTENNEIPEPFYLCPHCNSNKIKRYNFVLHIHSFKNINDYTNWKEMGLESYYKEELVTDIEKYFPYYNTLQWDNLLSDY